jgi:Flp pilus assembly pilin Flp
MRFNAIKNAAVRCWNILRHDEKGQDLVEYSLAAALIGLAAITSMKTLANNISNSFNYVGNTLANQI